MPTTPSPSRSPVWRAWCLGWALFIGIGAVAGAIMFWFTPDATGLTGLLPFLQKLPFGHLLFTTTFWPGLFLLVVIGATHLGAAAAILKRRPAAPWLALGCGVVLVGWISIQFVIFTLNPTSSAYLVFGMAETVMAALWLRRLRPTT